MEAVKRIDPIPPRELKTVEIDIEKKIFRVNGEDYGKVAQGFTLSCLNHEDKKKDWFYVTLRLVSNLTYTNGYDIDGNLTSEYGWKRNREMQHPENPDAANG